MMTIRKPRILKKLHKNIESKHHETINEYIKCAFDGAKKTKQTTTFMFVSVMHPSVCVCLCSCACVFVCVCERERAFSKVQEGSELKKRVEGSELITHLRPKTSNVCKMASAACRKLTLELSSRDLMRAHCYWQDGHPDMERTDINGCKMRMHAGKQLSHKCRDC